MKPDSFELVCNEKQGGRCVYDSDDYFNTNDHELLYSIKIDYNGNRTTVTWFPETDGVKLVSDDSPSEQEGRERATFALVCMKILLNEGVFMREL